MINNVKNLSGWYINVRIEIEDPDMIFWENVKDLKCKSGVINNISHLSNSVVIHLSMDFPNGRFSDAVNAATTSALNMFFNEFPNLLGNSGEAKVSIMKDEGNNMIIIPWLYISSLNNFNEILKDAAKQMSSDKFIYTF